LQHMKGPLLWYISLPILLQSCPSPFHFLPSEGMDQVLENAPVLSEGHCWMLTSREIWFFLVRTIFIRNVYWE
jgi:hypothetical protein